MTDKGKERSLMSSGVHSRPREASGLKPRARKFGETWWADRWINIMKGFSWGSRLERGGTYARRGQTLSIEVTSGRINAKVQGSRVQPYDVSIATPKLSDRTWEKVFDALASKAVFAAKLLAGDMPHEIEEAFYSAGTWLFPKTEHELAQNCSCPDTVRPCKHLAAVHFMVAEAFDDDPFLMFTLRGRTQTEVVKALHERRIAAPESTPPSDDGSPKKPATIEDPIILPAERFFDLRADLREDHVALDPPHFAVAALGPLKLDREDVLPELEKIVARVREGALSLAFESKDDAD